MKRSMLHVRRPSDRLKGYWPLFLAAAAAIAWVVIGAGGAAYTAPSPGSALYAAAGAELTHYDVQIDPPALVKKQSVMLPGDVQYAWAHPSNRYLYVTWSGGPKEHPNGLTTFRIDPASGALQAHGPPTFLKARSIHITVDRSGRHLLVAYNTPSSLSVHRLAADGAIAAEVPQPAGLDFGIYAHQVRVHDADGTVVLVTRGNMPSRGRPENPGALKIFGFKDGVLGNRGSVAPGGGYGFQPRDVDFHPSGKWLFASLEPQNRLHVYRQAADGMLGDQPIFVKESLPMPAPVRSEFYQRSGAVHVHPNGRYVYQAQRATDAIDGPGTGGWGSGTNAIGVFAIDQASGEPTLIQTADTHGVVPRTFALDPTNTVLIAGNQDRVEIKDGSSPTMTLLPSLALFRVLPNGKLDYLRRYEVETKGDTALFWIGIVPLSK
jgi:6-phosphogluconolactonase